MFRRSTFGFMAFAAAVFMVVIPAALGQTGKCCLPDGRGCRDVTQAQCQAFGGEFVAGQVCAHPDDTCDLPLSGACCQGTNCSVILQSACPAGSSFFPNNPCVATTCSPPSTGACCEMFQCRVTVPVDCPSGTFLASQGCTPSPCGAPPTGACCSGGDCTITINSACIGPGLEWYPNQPCEPAFCRLGACCSGPLSCVIVTQPGCEQGVWTADGVCVAFFCVVEHGACCLNASCVVTTSDDCFFLSGVFTLGGLCVPAVCVSELKACCTGTSCQLTSELSCTGTFNPSVSVCGEPGNPTTCCPANFNGAGGVSVQDIFDFLGAYFAGDGRADFNGVGGVTVQDIFDFLTAYFTGC